jgi:hypothetical protein
MDEPGFTPEEIERGEDLASHISIWGCVLGLAFLVVLLWLMFRAGMFMYGDR